MEIEFLWKLIQRVFEAVVQDEQYCETQGEIQGISPLKGWPGRSPSAGRSGTQDRSRKDWHPRSSQESIPKRALAMLVMGGQA